MEKQRSYEELIIKGIKELPPELLAEIVDFVYFVRKHFMQPDAFTAEVEATLRDIAPPASINEEPLKTGAIDKEWLSLAGTISPDDLQLMSEAIEASCERVDLDEW